MYLLIFQRFADCSEIEEAIAELTKLASTKRIAPGDFTEICMTLEKVWYFSSWLYSLYLVFDFMQSDLTRIISRPEGRLPEPQVKSYMLQQLLSGLQHCHRDVKASNLLIDKDRMLQIADFGLANFYRPKPKWPLASRVVTLWYRAPELLLGSTDYGVGIGMSSRGDVCRKANHAWQK
ncbi:unnamed protein product [Coffea canephora]|uniref:Protein kinase domain-containing protein n=1 Tax=Coffea canephora TaxID=49390 RepID=A0A068V8Q0_COFCA|nr:unnamed protein product [Coffea canephora]